MRLYNPRNGMSFDTESDDELHNAIYLDMGFLPAPEPEVRPGYQPEPVTYEPVATKKRRTTKSEPAKSEEPTD